ncbi:hypothetical protein [Nocardioides piscis]|uniref:WD40 repeat domain-containing protein n=1 Tax=Nocardioides piscis TaxID=2714938 RepID=A0A6G7YCF3_9ACTN|nr:hypothetical protein [Nocardioides piscis]QIK74475.1 hypothetical protein G7071_02500 [Nocardioides piscis]
MTHHGKHTGAARRIAVAAIAFTALALVPGLSGAAPSDIDPAALPRGADPAIVHMVRDTIRDGDQTTPATRRGQHQALWVVDGGYLVRDHDVGPRGWTRLVYITRDGGQRVVARSQGLMPVAVSESGRSVAVQLPSTPDGLRTVITVSRPRTGEVVAQRELRHANLVDITDHRALIGRRAGWHRPVTVWWSYQPDTLARVHDQAAVGADLRLDRVVFEQPGAGEFCNRVAVLSRPARTLWRSCRVYPHEWSPDGRHATATYTYFDAAGTPRWWVVDGRSAEQQSSLVGRLDKDTAWEDDAHFLTLAQSGEGKAAIIRCSITGACERASKVWDVPVPSESSLFYAKPPVVLATP